MKKLIFIVCVVFNILSYSYAYNDVECDYWAFNSIRELTEEKILSGYPNGNFEPESKMTIAEFLAVLTKVIGCNTDVSTISTHWAEDYINTAISNGIIDLDDYSAFNPDDYITRLEICRMLVNSFESTKKAKINTSKVKFTDVDIENSEEQRIATILKDTGILAGYPDGTAGFERLSTRAEISCFMNSVKNKMNKLKYYNNDIVYEDIESKANINDDAIILRKYEFANDDDYCTTIISDIQMFEFDRACETKYKDSFEKIFNNDHTYAVYRRKFGEGKYVLAIDFETINNTEDYNILTGYGFVNVFFDNDEEIYIVDSFDEREIDKQLASKAYTGEFVKPGKSLNTSAFYVINKLPVGKIRVTRPLTTLYGINTDELTDVNSFHSAIIYLKEE